MLEQNLKAVPDCPVKSAGLKASRAFSHFPVTCSVSGAELAELVMEMGESESGGGFFKMWGYSHHNSTPKIHG